jgi:hypothetical protein
MGASDDLLPSISIVESIEPGTHVVVRREEMWRVLS